MPQWGGTDNTNNSPIWVAGLVNQTANVANRDAMFNNTTTSSFVTGQKVGVFGVSAAEIKYSQSGPIDSIASIPVTTTGSGITSLPASITLTGGGGTAANVVAIGKLVTPTINGPGTGGSYVPGDTLTVAPGSANVSLAATIIVSATELRTAAVNAVGSGYANGDTVTVQTGTGTKAILTVTTGAANTSVASLALTNRGNYTVNPTLAAVATANTTGNGTGLTVDVTTRVKTVVAGYPGKYYSLPTLTANPVTGGSGTGATVDLSFGLDSTEVILGGYNYTSAPTPTNIGNSAFGTVVMGPRPGQGSGTAHAGWVLRKQGTGGRAGRVTTEVLVASGSITGDSSSTDDTSFPQ